MNINNILKDYKEFQQLQGELNYFADAGRSYEEIYDEGFIDYLENMCNKYEIVFDKKMNDWEYCIYFQTKESELERKMEKLIKYGDFDNCVYDLTLREIYRNDLKNVKNKLLIPNIDYIKYNEDSLSWYIDDTEIVDELYYDCYTILHPKEIIGYIDEIIENELKLNINNRRE
ncbi:MAG: hypothetical protein J6J36_08210 [Clostridia bacterium]|nr:hypothetical protein [Clostridia bacterium]MBP3708557.1 hypothetical protein [Clostridia bacterium]